MTPVLIAIVEDCPEQASIVQAMLSDLDVEVRVFPDAAGFESGIAPASFAAVILDWELPDGSGIELLERLRRDSTGRPPVLMLTARDEEDDVATALDAGADDYVVKPPRQRELQARMRALLRRSLPAGIESLSPYVLDQDRREVRIGARSTLLTAREYELARFLFEQPGALRTRVALETEVLGLDPRVSSRALDTHISRIRRKLELDGRHGFKLEGVYQRGYRLMRIRTDA